jgi:hypothetical protein
MGLLCPGKKIIKFPDGTRVDIGGIIFLEELIVPWCRGAIEIQKQAIDGAMALRSKYPKMPTEDLLVNRAWSIVNKKIAYVSDSWNYDYWQDASCTCARKKGDCEDTAILTVSACRRITLPVELAIGYYVSGKEWMGHGFGLYTPKQLKKVAVLETTWDSDVSPGMWILRDGSHYHVTISGDENGFTQRCTCTRCREMMEYLTTGNEAKVRWGSPRGYAPMKGKSKSY